MDAGEIAIKADAAESDRLTVVGFFGPLFSTRNRSIDLG
jgi:hypothetical protein